MKKWKLSLVPWLFSEPACAGKSIQISTHLDFYLHLVFDSIECQRWCTQARNRFISYTKDAVKVGMRVIEARKKDPAAGAGCKYVGHQAERRQPSPFAPLPYCLSPNLQYALRSYAFANTQLIGTNTKSTKTKHVSVMSCFSECSAKCRHIKGR